MCGPAAGRRTASARRSLRARPHKTHGRNETRLTMPTIPAVVPPAPREKRWHRDLAPSAAFAWLAAGWRDFLVNPLVSLAYGLLVFLISITIVVGLFALG